MTEGPRAVEPPQRQRRRAALIELDGSHAETLYSHAFMLDRLGYSVHLLLRTETRQLLGDAGPVDAIACFDIEPSFVRSLPGVRRLQAYLRDHAIDLVVLNTAEGRRVRNLCAVARDGRPFIGVVHNAHKLEASFTQSWITRRLAGYFVLAETIARNLAGGTVRIEPFYPIYFPAVDVAAPRDDVFEIVVPGRIDPRRRDYASLLDELRRVRLHPSVRIVFLGDGSGAGGAKVRAALAALGEQIEIAAGFIPEREFLQRIARARLVLPLITPRCPEFARYRSTKISGAYDLAYGFGVPMLNHESLAHLEEIRLASVLYADGALVCRVNALIAAPQALDAVRMQIRQHAGFALAAQTARYARLVARA